MPVKGVSRAAAEGGPTIALTLSLVGLVLQVFGALFSSYVVLYWPGGYWWSGMMGPWMMGSWMAGFWWPICVALAAIIIALGVVGVIWMNSRRLSRVRSGSILVLVASVIAFPTMFGFIIGSILMFVGGILGLMWQPVTEDDVKS